MNKPLLTMEVPAQLLDIVDPLIDGHFVIATELLNNAAYYSWYKRYRHNPQRKLVMLDNGAYEAETVDCECLHELAISIGADLVWAPDTLFDGEKSFAQTAEFLCFAGRDVPYKIGIIPQGKDASEIVDNYIDLYHSFKGLFSIVGLSFKNPREQVVRHIHEPIHYLGLRGLDEISTWPDSIISMDTVKPIKAAFFNQKLEDLQRGAGIWNSHMEVENLELVYRNIAKLHQSLTKKEWI